MNERIKQLAEQARFAMEVSNDPNSPPSWWGAGHNDTFERFAELIVKECIKVVEETNLVDDDPVANIKQHFGVE